MRLYNNQIIRYLFIASINALINYGVFSLLIFLKLHYALASLLSVIFGIIFGFKIFSYLVFNNKNNLLIYKYLIVWAIIYFFNLTCLSILNYFRINNYISGFIIIFPSAILGFLLNKKFVFKRSQPIYE